MTAQMNPTAPSSLTVRDALGMLNARVSETSQRAEASGGSLAQDSCRDAKALICIEARTAYIALLEFLSLVSKRSIDQEEFLFQFGHDNDIKECVNAINEFDKAAHLLRQLSTDDSDPYLRSVEQKLKAVKAEA